MNNDQLDMHEEIEQLKEKIKRMEEREKVLLEKLQVQEMVYERILDALPMTIFLEDVQGRTLFANKKACEYNNKTRKELTGMTVFDFFPQYVAKEQRQEDLTVWKEKRLRVKEILVEFDGEKTNLFCGKTIVEVQNKAYLLGFGLDITSRIKAEKLLKESEEKFRKLVEQAADCFILYNSNGEIIDVNNATCKSLRYTREQLLSLTFKDITKFNAEEINRISEGVCANHCCNYEHEMICSDNTVFPVDTSFSSIFLEDKKMYLAWCRDISDRKKAEKQIKHMAYHDALTGLPNRWFVHDYIKKYLQNSKGEKSTLAFFLLDLDYFKAINDQLGHQAGDELLQKVSTRLKTLFSEETTLARLGGDEFLLLLPNLYDQNDVISVSAQINGVMASPFFIAGQELNVSTSIGISLYPKHGDNFTTLLKNADIALYQTKEQGRNGYNIFKSTTNLYN